MKAVVKYRGAFAHYAIAPETTGVYHAQLIKYDGPPNFEPPTRLTLVKSMHHWRGNSDHEELLDELGHIIESRVRHRNPHNPR